MYFVGQIRRFRYGGSDRFGKIVRFGSKIEFRLFGKMYPRPENWMHVSTDTNPGDVTTKLLSPNACVSCEMWGKGPDFLQLENIDMLCQNFFGVWGRL